MFLLHALVALVLSVPQVSSAPGGLLTELQGLRSNRPAALRVVKARHAETLDVLNDLQKRFDGSIRSARTRPEQRKVEYDRDALETGLWIGKLYADATSDTRPWQLFVARKQRIEGTELLNARNYRQALVKLDAALAGAQRLKDPWLTVITLINIAYARLEMGQPKVARDLTVRAAKEAERLDARAKALALFDVGAAHVHLGEYAESIPYSKASAASAREAGIKLWEGNALLNLAVAYRQLGQRELALETLTHALAVITQTSDKLGTGRTLFNLGLISMELQQYAKAAEYLERALPLIREVDLRHSHEIELDPKHYYNPLHESALRLLVDAYTKSGRPEKAAPHSAALQELLRTKPKETGHTHR